MSMLIFSTSRLTMCQRNLIVAKSILYFLLSYAIANDIDVKSSPIVHKYKLTYIPDAKVVYPSLIHVNLHAFATAPREYVYIGRSSIPNAGLGVFAAHLIPRLSYFGPYGGRKFQGYRPAGKSDYAWEIPDKSRNVTQVVDGADLNVSNWLRFINCPNTLDQQNLLAFVRNGEIYYLTVRNITVGEELLVYYGDNYATRLGIDTSQFP